jgi:hypothetical protein
LGGFRLNVAASDDSSAPPSGESGLLPRHLCRVMGLNQNYSSRSGTSYHIQVEDHGPVFDDVTEAWVRRVNVIAYANYGETTARIVHGKDHDLPDVRTHAHNRDVSRHIQDLASQAVDLLEEKEGRQVARIKKLLKRYYDTRDETVKREFEAQNALYPFVFARAFQELRSERPLRPLEPLALPASEASEPGVAETSAGADSGEFEYPLDPTLRELVLEIERVSGELQRDLAALKARGAADDILQSTCAKLATRARESLGQRHGVEFAARHLEMTRNSLVTAYRQVRARLTRAGGA